ncbi:carbohydrate binding protein with CBM6 domain [Amycolatopsis sulphurea]|uniref:Carbohydrate binding protein with CBM6 domain n=1 Tax=Amycolatopsis sulphurea TaxID=76022 RepID=A0A2A9F5K8_9PSEU|nr:TIM-barrel domain-containing protein [Amycolatopsis sulphurea]PFG46448.1 carbohydrate binding protein with CBM6 domain [Amycolatopsis sulphurea]
MRATAGIFRRLGILTAAVCTTVTGLSAPPATASVQTQTVTTANARFQVLSPTLIRTEYSGDGNFADPATFNAIGRGSFAATPFTSTVSGGVLTIRTSAVSLSYRLGSGPFDTSNLSVRLTAGTPVTAAPWQRLVCAAGELCEAEELSHDGPGVGTDHKGSTGTGFLAGFEGDGATVSADVEAPADGAYTLSTRYANGQGGDSQHVTRTLSVTVDGGPSQKLSLPATTDWDTWSVASVDLPLSAGRHTVALTRAPGDSGHVNLDSLAVLQKGAQYPSTSARAITGCGFGASCEAEDGRLAGTTAIATDHNGHSGSGFTAGMQQGGGLTQRIENVPADGKYALHVRYANGTGGDGKHETRTVNVTANGTTRQLQLPATADWDTWNTASIPVDLKAGKGEVALGCRDANSCHINADTLSVTPLDAPAPQPHFALGRYRRGLDGVNGEKGAPATVEGLLHQDGWYLLDDTASAFYDQRSGKVTQRPSHGGKPYQDGYLFGFGRDYQGGLKTLSQLTGPPKLLPRWAYGVWYSEYIDRTEADYRNTILPKFRSEGVPLDVLVVDTDFKAPDTWNGWEMDRKKFPDPKGFFSWAHGEGLHTTLNIHPSIQESDPQYAKAQSIAKGKLAPGCGDGCRVFDWGDPDQLKAYLSLHNDMNQAGNDFWWLDWCCDAARSSLPGVTPDAWINQQYAANMPGRGFAFSRAYGSLQSGGYGNPTAVPTGPWADKRSTLHFTGDTLSTWGTLAMEIGATPNESAATGMSAISHDIGGHVDTAGLPGGETYVEKGQQKRTTKLPDDLYARWVQLGTFQPIDRLHSNHSDRLPWQYGPEAGASAKKFLNLRENLVPYTYSLAQQAATTGVPVVRPTYLQYPNEAAAYPAASKEYFYGPDVLVAPVTTPGSKADTSVWFPPGQWTDYFTGRTYQGGTTQTVSTDLGTMPVFLRSGGILATHTANVQHDAAADQLTVTAAVGGSGTFPLYEDDGEHANRSSTTKIGYAERNGRHTLTVAPTAGKYPGQPAQRTWTVALTGLASAPANVTVNGKAVTGSWDSAKHVLTVQAPKQPIGQALTVSAW